MTNSKSLVKFFNALVRWFLLICCFEREGKQPREISDKDGIEDTPLFGCDSARYSNMAIILRNYGQVLTSLP